MNPTPLKFIFSVTILLVALSYVALFLPKTASAQEGSKIETNILANNSSFDQTIEFINNYDFFPAHESRSKLVGILVYCKEQKLVDKLVAQNITGYEVETYFTDPEMFPELNDEQKAYNTALAIMFIAGYSFGVELAYNEYDDTAKQDKIKNDCKLAKHSAKKELKRKSVNKAKSFKDLVDLVLPILSSIHDEYSQDVLNGVWLIRNNQDGLAKFYINNKIHFEEGISSIIKDQYKSASDKSLKKYKALATSFLVGTATGHSEFRESTLDKEALDTITENTIKKSQSITLED